MVNTLVFVLFSLLEIQVFYEINYFYLGPLKGEAKIVKSDPSNLYCFFNNIKVGITNLESIDK